MMHPRQSQERITRRAGFLFVTAMHGALLYSLWHYDMLPPPAEAATVFVSLLKAPPRPEPPAPEPRPVEQEKSVETPAVQALVAEVPVELPDEPVAPPPPKPKSKRIVRKAVKPVRQAPPPPVAQAEPEVLVSHAPPSSPPVTTGPVVLDSDLAVTCPGASPSPYPSRSRRLGEQGRVILSVELDEQGRVDRAAIKTSSGYARLDEAALATVKRWHCNPARRNGMAVRSVALQTLHFVLEGH
jgi:periplasmic protein TonB